MDTTQTEILFTRRSIRKYKPNMPVSRKQIEFLLDAAMCAPSARNRQSWQFIVIENRDTLNALAEMHPYGKMLSDAPLAILVCGDLELEERDSANALNGAAATQNILLAAHGIGLGGVWLGIYPSEDRVDALRQMFGFPGHILPISLISLGHPDEEKPRNSNYKADKVHWGAW